MEAVLFLVDVPEEGPGFENRAGALARALSSRGFCSAQAGTQRVHRARRRGGFTLRQADEAAVALGHHPAEIWPQWYEAVSS